MAAVRRQMLYVEGCGAVRVVAREMNSVAKKPGAHHEVDSQLGKLVE